MRALSTALFLFAALVNLAPVAGVQSAERLRALYGVAIDDPNLVLLMRHRAVLFAIFGLLLVAGAFHAPLRGAAIAAGLASMLSFVALAFLAHDASSVIRRIAWIDVVASLALVAAALLDARSRAGVIPG
jgi:hypothetical protein